MALARQDTSGISGPVLLPSPLAGLPEMGMEIAAIEAVIPDIPIDGGMADGEDAVHAQPSRDLFRAPFQAQEREDDLQVSIVEAPVTSGLAPPGPGSGNGLAGAVGAVIALVTLDFAPDSGAVPAELAGDVGI